jgi:acyl carrier protein
VVILTIGVISLKINKMKKFEYNPTCYHPTIFEKMEEIIRDKLGIDCCDKITSETTWEDLGADSLDVVELIMELEKEYGIAIPDERAEQCYNVGEAHDLVKELIVKKNMYG